MVLRADAQRNLDRLLAAARECFAERGIDVSVDEVARRAGVGHGTAFRHFPTKDALVSAVIRKELEELIELADEALLDPDPGAGFERYFRAMAAAYGKNQGLVEGFKRCIETEQAQALLAGAARLVERAQACGAVRPELDADDVLALIKPASEYPDVILAGLRPEAASISR